MATLTNARGEVVDLTTGEVVGRAEGAPTEVDARKATGPDVAAPEGKTAQGLINNLSWGFNTALFALPDTGPN